jgi:hypothetical protein
MENIDFEKITISKAYNFKNINGKYCHINYLDNYLEFDLNAAVAFNVNFNYPKPNLFIYLNKNTTTFNKNIKDTLVKLVEAESRTIFGKNLDSTVLSEFYCDPHKNIQKGKKFLDVLKLKINCAGINELFRNTRVNLKVHISGMWFSENSFGPYLNVTEIEVLENLHKSLFIEEPESEIDL